MNAELVEVLEQMSHEKDLSMKTVVGALAAGIRIAYERQFPPKGGRDEATLPIRIRVTLEPEAQNFRVSVIKRAVDIPKDEGREIPINLIKQSSPGAEVGSDVEVELRLEEFSRGSMQIVRQETMRRINEAEQRRVSEEYHNKVGKLVVGVVKRVDGQQNVYLTVGRTEIMLPRKEQVPTETYRPTERYRLYVSRVDEPTGTSDSVVKVSRSHWELLRKLFEIEVPEVRDGTVELKAIARDAGIRSKISVASNDESVDPVGACVGQGGKRVIAVTEELRDEKIDIVRWKEDPVDHLIEALRPAEVDIIILNEDEHTVTAVVGHENLSVAIGKGGRNVSLAARLTGWRIDIRSQQQISEMVNRNSPNEPNGGKAEHPDDDPLETSDVELPENVDEDHATVTSEAATGPDVPV